MANDQTKSTDTEATDTKAAAAAEAKAEAKAAAAAAKATATANARIAELEAQLAAATAQQKPRTKARTTAPDAVDVVVVDGTVQGPNDAKSSVDDGLPAHRLYKKGETLVLSAQDAEQLSDLGYVTILS